MAHAEATDNPLAKAVLMDIANEERVHVREFNRLIQILTGDEDTLFAKGATEVDEMAQETRRPRGLGRRRTEDDRWIAARSK